MRVVRSGIHPNDRKHTAECNVCGAMYEFTVQDPLVEVHTIANQVVARFTCECCLAVVRCNVMSDIIKVGAA